MSSKKYMCPACKGKTGVEIVYGMPTEEAFESANRNELILGGCCAEVDAPERKCTECGHEWMIKRRKP